MTQPPNLPETETIFNYTVSLFIGAWKNRFPRAESKLLICEALNFCTKRRKFKVIGYFLDDECLSLALEFKGKEETALDELENRLLSLVRLHMRRFNKPGPYRESDAIRMPEQPGTMFHFGGVPDVSLIRLITGRQVALPFFDPHLDTLKSRISRSVYCSAIDYLGGEGPVIVKKIKKWPEKI